jgi:hypothetical protein
MKKQLTVAKYLEQQMALSDKSQKDIATAIGYDKPNIMTMFKQGSTKVPVNKVGPLAKALNVDPVYMFRLVMQEYMPETWQAIEEVLSAQRLVTEGELQMLKAIRKHTKDTPIDLSDPREAKKLGELLEKFADTVLADRESAGRAAKKAA